MRQDSEIAIVGRACRLPGAPSIARLWALLREGRCAVSRVPSDRWSLERFGHPRQGERGKSYTWAAGVLDDIWGFDAAAFGLSPREAEQMDPQQRLLLELTWEALEDAGIRPSSIAGSEVGVFVGASTTDHGTSKIFDAAATDGYFATGNAASILANRISYIFDLNGPSFTVDTACSSSLVALDAAVQTLRSGRIDTAIVGGVSVLVNPFQFINFSQASMLSRTGLCQAFSARADGYVRSEGGAVLVLRAVDAKTGGGREHARIAATRVNSDGRTNGIALPSGKRQAQLLDQLYGPEAIDPDRLAFVEAHGTGTPVGDPIEAGALGKVLGRRRTAPLLVGSIKSNIGHTEAAAGMAGMLKAMLALEHDVLPPTLHCDELNPTIDFDGLNLAVARAPTPLGRASGQRLAGVSSYGFGGTNAHVVLADPPPPARKGATPVPASVMMLSAHSRAALGALAAAYAERLDGDARATAAVAAAANHRRDRLEERLVVRLDVPADLPRRLRAFAESGADDVEGLTVGTAIAGTPKVAFVFSGNGGQWVGMGRAAYRGSVSFRTRFDEVDRLFEALSGWSLVGAMHSETLPEQLVKTSVAQPLIFAIQAATTYALRERGLVPDIVLGHSVGEVGAAEAAGILDLRTAVRVIYYRSLHQEAVFQVGGMAVLIGAREAARSIEAAVPDAVIAAYNSPRAFTFSGSTAGIEAVAKAARGLKARTQPLDIAYPFHSPLIAGIRQPLLDSLGDLASRPATAVFVSTVTGAAIGDEPLGADYWWRNIREPVLFTDAVAAAAAGGARIFVEIGPSAILLSHVGDILAADDIPVATLAVLDRKDRPGDPFERAAAAAMARGAVLPTPAVIGDDPGAAVDLPTYPWQRKTYRLADTADALPLLTPLAWHPLVGARYAGLDLEWHAQLDTALLPDLADHVVDGHILLPGAAFAEMALAVARDWLGTTTASLAGFEIHQPLILAQGGARDVRCRVQPMTGTVEIMSRPRLSPAAWQTHAVAKILRQTVDPEPMPAMDRSAPSETATGEAIYPLAAASGLAYGPAFRLLRTARRFGPTSIVVDLVPGDQAPRYGLDPARVDACFHGLALLYRELAVDGRLKPYVPVGAGEIRLFTPGVPVERAIIAVERSDERIIIVDFTLLDGQDRPVALLRRMRFQAMSAFRAAERAAEHIVATAVLAAEPLAVPDGPSITAADVLAAAKAVDGLGENEDPSSDFILMDGWATATAYGLLESLSDNGLIDVDALVRVGRLPAALRDWARRLLSATERSGLVTRLDDGLLALKSGVDLPDPQDILRALAADHPERSAELLLAARTGALVGAILAGTIAEAAPVSLAAVDGFELGGRAASGAASLLAAILDQLGGAWPTDRMMRILVLGDGPLTPHAVRIAARRGAALTLVEPDRRRLERARLGVEPGALLMLTGDVAALAPQGFDIVVASQSAHRILADEAARTGLAAAMAPGAVLAVIEPSSSVFRTVVFGLQGAMQEQAGETAGIELATEAAWTAALRGMGLEAVSAVPARGTDFGLLCLGQKPAVRTQRAVKAEALIVGRGGAMEATAEALTTMLKFSGCKASGLIGGGRALDHLAEVPDTIVYLGQARSDIPVVDQLAARCLDLRTLAAAIGTRRATLWVVCPGATRAVPEAAGAVEAGVWAFCRTLANETPTLDVRLIDLAPDLPAEVASRRLRDVVLSGTDESEIIADAAGTRVLRFGKLAVEAADAIAPDELVLRLVKGDHATGLDRLTWARQHRQAPGAGEVEIAVEAAGLNFRDVMWGLSILPEEILEDGFAGATLGLECAGRVVRVGPGVTDFAVGDSVLAFAKAALATHVTVSTAVVAARPLQLDAAAAATIPVTFLTAYYGLIRCARLDEDEWVLIHGGAGGVGLAAMQIARWRGARIIATAGSPERRDLLTMLGAEHVFDSRSNQFVDDVRRVTGEGVAVVLNSLSGEAMERSIAVLRPFGRFVELGKRDYVANTHIGLKPFRRNLSYFGVDLDQLMMRDDTAGRTLFTEVMTLFADGAFAPLPYRAFAASETVEAFRVMQRSGHIGKIVMLPPPLPASPPAAIEPMALSADGAHLITGGLGGFGLETARWLVDHGARHLVLVGRSGATTEAARQGTEALRAAGATVTAVAVDITDEAAMAELVARFGRDLPPLAGVVHAATVFDDALIANMTPQQLHAVLAAKVTGAAILDRLTATLPLDYLLLYSSATTIIGNPGQGAYVAANGFLEGLARARRLRGLPAFAVAWGAIADVGVLTRSSTAAANLLQRSGVLGMMARSALDDLFQMVPRVGPGPDAAVLAIAAVNWSAAREHLPVLRSRSFERLTHGLQTADASGKAKLNVGAMVREMGAGPASKAIVETILDEIARILRLPRDDVSRTKPLMDIGLDSLMAVELGMGLEERFELDAPLSTSAGAMTVVELADYIVGSSADSGARDQTTEDLALRHLDPDIRKDVIEALPTLTVPIADPRRDGTHTS